MPLFAERRREDVLRAFKAGRVHIFEREIQILRTSLGVGGQAAVAGLAHFFERVVAGEMNDVDGRAGHFREGDGARSGFGFGGGRARERVIFRRAFSFGQRLLDDHVNRLRRSPRACRSRPLCFAAWRMALKIVRVINHEDARVGHEELEAGDAFADELAHLLELRGAEIGDDAVEGVVNDGLVVGFLHPGVESLAERLPFVLDGEVDKRGGAAESRRDGAGLEIIGAGGAAEGHVEMGVDINAAGDQQAAGGVDDAAGVFDGKPRGEGADFLAVDADVGDASIRRRDHRAVANYRVELHECPQSEATSAFLQTQAV